MYWVGVRVSNWFFCSYVQNVYLLYLCDTHLTNAMKYSQQYLRWYSNYRDKTNDTLGMTMRMAASFSDFKISGLFSSNSPTEPLRNVSSLSLFLSLICNHSWLFPIKICHDGFYARYTYHHCPNLRVNFFRWHHYVF